MRVALDARPLQSASGGRGIGRYLRELAPRLAESSAIERLWLHLDARLPDPPDLPAGPGIEALRIAAAPGPASLVDRLRVAPSLLAVAPDLYHGTLLPPPRLPAGVATVMTVHDLIPLLAPGSVPARAALVFRLAFSAASRCERVLAVSRFTARTVSEHLGLPPERVVVTRLGVSAQRFGGSPRGACPVEGGRYLLHVGGFDREKNLELLLEVAARLAADLRAEPLPLVVAGEGGERARAFAREVRARGLEGLVRLTGRLDEGELAAAYAGASLFLFPSRLEGFGLPPLEAMASGCPVLASEEASLPEVVGEAGLLLPADDPLPWVEVIRRLVSDPERGESLARAGRERAALFTWEATARATLAGYREACEVA